MNKNVFSRVCKISLVACLALVLGTSFADASRYGQGYSHKYQPSHHGHGQLSYRPAPHGSYHRPPQHCAPRYQPQPHYGYQGRSHY